MGLYNINCPSCRKVYQWFSGDHDQRCPGCKRIHKFEDRDGKMKATLLYTLPEEQIEFERAVKVGDAYAALQDFSGHLLKKYKHVDAPSEEAMIEFEENGKVFHEILEKWSVEL